jgi:hypothetical protein
MIWLLHFRCLAIEPLDRVLDSVNALGHRVLIDSAVYRAGHDGVAHIRWIITEDELHISASALLSEARTGDAFGALANDRI